MTDPMKSILNNVLEDSRKFFNLKSGNKIYLNLDRLPDKKRESYSAKKISERIKLINRVYEDSRHSKTPYEINKVLLKVQGKDDHAGNCDHYSYMAFELLKNKKEDISNIYKKPFSISIIGIKSFRKTFGHAFLFLSNTHQFILEDIFIKNTDSESWVLDPWDNITCRSYQYPLLWHIKMLKWRAKGKSLIISNTPTSPTNSDCYQLMKLQKNNRFIVYKEDFQCYSLA
ncbi:hypothetical protein [Xenorhabdus bharatensis]|uniref:hypothetical protein n=1 Tax=Xenorhabdus bharatensis TaxID=3136256 RepID=UPI0030F471CC